MTLQLLAIILRFVALSRLPLAVKLRRMTEQEASDIRCVLYLDAGVAIAHSDKYRMAKRRREAAAYAE